MGTHVCTCQLIKSSSSCEIIGCFLRHLTPEITRALVNENNVDNEKQIKVMIHYLFPIHKCYCPRLLTEWKGTFSISFQFSKIVMSQQNWAVQCGQLWQLASTSLLCWASTISNLACHWSTSASSFCTLCWFRDLKIESIRNDCKEGYRNDDATWKYQDTFLLEAQIALVVVPTPAKNIRKLMSNNCSFIFRAKKKGPKGYKNLVPCVTHFGLNHWGMNPHFWLTSGRAIYPMLYQLGKVWPAVEIFASK